MRALLLYNPAATGCTRGLADAVARALSTVLTLEVAATKRRDHASFLAAGAASEGYDVVVAFGGDGTVNEVVQGLTGTGVRLAIVPGGSTNAWARTLGLPRDPSDATVALLRRLRDHRDRQVNLGTANGRFFCFSAGFGFDAEVVRHVERRSMPGRRRPGERRRRSVRTRRAARQATFLWCGLVVWARGRLPEGTDVTVSVPGGESCSGLRSVVCCNCDPWTYLGPRPVRICPDADLDRGLDLVALRSLRLGSLLPLARAALTTGDVAPLPAVRLWHDGDAYDLSSPRPLALEVDGDYVGDVADVRLRSVRSALTVVA